MQKYIVDLTDNLIRQYRFDEICERVRKKTRNDSVFFETVRNILDVEKVSQMNPETLGRIMCSLEIGDVMARKQELFNELHFARDCGDFLRRLVALCLTYAIIERLSPNRLNSVPAFTRPRIKLGTPRIQLGTPEKK